MRNNPFNFKRTFAGALGLAWPLTGVTLEDMMYLFYHVRNFRVNISGIDVGGSDVDVTADPTGAQNGGGFGGAGLSQRRCECAPRLLSDLDDAFKLTIVTQPKQTDIDAYNALKLKAQTTAAPGESKTFLRAIDINTSGVYPILYFSGNQISVRIDFGSVQKIGELFFPACCAVLGTSGSSIDGLFPIGYITVVGMGGLQIPIYDTTGNLGFASGTMTPYEVYDDLEFSPGGGNGGQTVQIKMPDPDASVTDITKQKVFSGFHNVIQISFDGFDITQSKQINTAKVGTDPTSQKDIINETCTVVVPKQSRTGYFSFVCEGKDDYGATVFDQFTIPKRFVVNDYPVSLYKPS